MSDSVTLSLQAAHQLLSQWDCLGDRPPSGAIAYSRLRAALHTVKSHSDNQILGICADSLATGKRALVTYAQALGYGVDVTALQQPGQGAAYIKYNPESGLLYASDYEGNHRGVLVSCQSHTEFGLNEMYGHLPLDLFPETLED